MDEDAEPSGTVLRKRRTRRRKRHNKGKAAASTTSTATPPSGGSDDEVGNLSCRKGPRAVVTWGDLGLGSFGGGKTAPQSSAPPMLAKCEKMRRPMPPPPLKPPPVVGSFSDASERSVPPALPPGHAEQQQHQWLPTCGETSLCIPLASSPCWEEPFAFGEMSIAEHFTFPMHCSSPCGMPPSTTMFPIAGLTSFPCTPTAGAMAAAPAPPPQTPAAAQHPETSGPASVISFLHGNSEPICGEDLAEKLRSLAQETYED